MSGLTLLTFFLPPPLLPRNLPFIYTITELSNEGIKKCQDHLLTFFMWCGIVADYSSLRKMV